MTSGHGWVAFSGMSPWQMRCSNIENPTNGSTKLLRKQLHG
jgi:hypothetical protein